MTGCCGDSLLTLILLCGWFCEDLRLCGRRCEGVRLWGWYACLSCLFRWLSSFLAPQEACLSALWETTACFSNKAVCLSSLLLSHSISDLWTLALAPLFLACNHCDTVGRAKRPSDDIRLFSLAFSSLAAARPASMAEPTSCKGVCGVRVCVVRGCVWC